MNIKFAQNFNKQLIWAGLLCACLLFAVFFLMRHVQTLLSSDIKINLTEIVTQNKDVINSKLKVEVNNLNLVSRQISTSLHDHNALTAENLSNVASAYTELLGRDEIYVASSDGTAFFGNGISLNIAGRRYFQTAMRGETNISERLISRTSGHEIFVISVPLFCNDQVVGTVQRSYSPEEMYALCSLSLFSSRGHMHIINRDGYVQISSQNEDYSAESDNYYRTLTAQGNGKESSQLEQDVKSGQAGFLETTNQGQKFFSAYTPMDDIHDWYLITSIDTHAVSSNANTVVRMFYFILFILVAVFSCSLSYFFSFKKKQQTALAHLAFVDQVTQGNTFTKFLVDLDHALTSQNNSSHTILSFDIDNFKYVNTYYGFDVGDRILKHMYAQLSQKLNPNESMARISGDHFVAFLENASPERLDDFLPLAFKDQDITVYLSGGSYLIGDPTESVNLMVDKAGTAAQSGKGLLRKKITPYSEAFDEGMIANEQLKRDIEQALFARDFIPYYQPKVDVSTGKLVGAEALARWRREDGRMISPAEFIPLCEKTGQIMELDMVIFVQVLEFLSEKLRAGIDCVPISVNFSRLHLVSDEFIPMMMSLIMAHDVPPAYIEVELTESVIFENHEIIVDFANRLHQHGILVCMDDFGSGYSSLNLLKDIPIDVLKIDKGFLDATTNRERQRAILASIADLARRLKTDVVVEGVETEDNVAMMKEFDCRVAQGFYFARPMPTEDFEKIFEKGMI